MKSLRVAVLVSGRGTNLEALLQPPQAHWTVVGVVSNVAGAEGLGRAQRHGVPNLAIPHIEFPDRQAFDAAVAQALDSWQPDLIVLAGFMRILTTEFVARYSGRMINIHPSLLPKYPGLHTHRQVLEAGDSEHGASVHFVTTELDGGPVIAQIRMPVLGDDTIATLAARLLPLEHRLLRYAVGQLATRRITYASATTICLEGQALEAPLQLDAHCDPVLADLTNPG